MPTPSFLGEPIAIPAGPAAPGADRTPQIDFPLQPQLQSQWCWAAVTASVAAYYAARHEGDPVTQQDLATTYIGVECHLDPLPPFSSDWAGNRPYGLVSPLQNCSHLDGDDALPNALEFDGIRKQIDAEKPICCNLSITHCMVINGYDVSNGQEVFVSDPAGVLHGFYQLDQLGKAAGGEWIQTCLTKARTP